MLRHVCASWLGQMQGVEALTIRDLLGHSSVTMTDRYMHGDQADLHDAVHKLENFRSHSGRSKGGTHPYRHLDIHFYLAKKQ